jgi:hypothetical protein
MLSADPVGPREQVRNLIVARRTGLDGFGYVGFEIAHRYGGAGDDPACGVADDSHDCRAFLARRRGGTHLGDRVKADRRDGELKMDWTKPPRDRSAYGY